MHRTASNLLFGGTLVLAGVPAAAQEFILFDEGPNDGLGSYAYAYVAIDDPDSPLAYLDAADDTSPLLATITGTSAAYGTSTVTASSNAYSIGVSSEWDGNGAYGYAYNEADVFQYFQVTEDGDLTIEWDFRGVSPGGAIFVERVSEGGGFPLFFLDLELGGGQQTGTAMIPVNTGQDYLVGALLSGAVQQSGLRFARVTLGPAVCNEADIAAPIGVLDSADLTEAIGLLQSFSIASDFDGNGFLNFFDVIEAARLVDQGCDAQPAQR